MAIPEIVRTDVDSLTELIKEKREISFEDTSKILGLPGSTIEAWASFLEEEDVVTIKYKFTKPFFVYKKTDIKEAPKAQPTDLKIYINRIDVLLNQLNESKKKYQELEIFKEVLNGLKNFKDGLAEEIGLEGDIDAKLNKDILDAEHYITEITTDVANNSIENAIKKTDVLLDKLNQNFFLLKTLFEEEKLIEKREIIKNEGFAEDLLKKAYDYIQQGKFKSALDSYDQLEKKYENLPQEFLERKDLLKKDLIKLNRDLSSKMSESSSKKIEDNEKEINDLIKTTYSSLKKNDIHTAMETYEQVEKLFNEIPPGFLDEKTIIHHKILGLQETLISKKRTIFFQDLQKKTKEINTSLFEIKSLMVKGNIDDAINTYQIVREIFATLPHGFLQERTELQNRIIDTYRSILSNKTQTQLKSMQEKSAQIETLLSNIPQYVAKNDIKNANSLFQQIENIYKTIPQGFLPQKTELQNKILRMSEMIAKKLDRLSVTDLNTKQEKIKKIMKEIKELIKAKDYDMAFAAYEELVLVYNSLPSGFMKKKTDIRNDLLNTYREILVRADSIIIGNTDEKRKYDNILKLLIRMHNYIDQGEFGMLEADYEKLSELYNQLPLGFVNKKARIVDEVMNMHGKVSMLAKLNEIKENISKGDSETANKNLNLLARLYQEAKKDTKDARLNEYIYNLYTKYSQTAHYTAPKITRTTESPAITELKKHIEKTEKDMSDFKYVERMT